LECLQIDFLWDGPSGEFEMHLVNWKIICSPIPRGGLGIENIMLFNKALVGKWLWRFGQEENSLWRWVTVMKYGIQRGGWCLKEA
jgi:hypothetical protein